MRIDLIFILLLIWLKPFAQNGLTPIPKIDDFFFDHMWIQKDDVVLHSYQVKNKKRSLEILTAQNARFTIDEPEVSLNNATPFFYLKDNQQEIWTTWIYSSIDSFHIIMTNYDINSETHTIRQKVSNSGTFVYANLIAPMRFHEDYFTVITLTNNPPVAEIVLLIKVSKGNKISIESCIQDTVGNKRTLFDLEDMEDFHILDANRILFRAVSLHGIAMTNWNLDLIDQGGPRYIDKSGKAYFSHGEGFGIGSVVDHKVDAYGLAVANVWGRSDLVIMTYSVSDSTIATDTLYIFNNPDDHSLAFGKSTELSKHDVIVCTNPYYGGQPWKSNVPSELFFKRIRNRNQVWHKKYSSNYYLRMRDMVAIDSCKFIITGSMFDYFGSDLLHGFYAKFDCDGNLITSNVDLREVESLIYPNPNNGSFKVEIEDYQNLQYSVYSIDGKMAHRGTLDGQQVDLSHLMTGTYILNIETSSGVLNQKVVIKN